MERCIREWSQFAIWLPTIWTSFASIAFQLGTFVKTFNTIGHAAVKKLNQSTGVYLFYQSWLVVGVHNKFWYLITIDVFTGTEITHPCSLHMLQLWWYVKILIKHGKKQATRVHKELESWIHRRKGLSPSTSVTWYIYRSQMKYCFALASFRWTFGQVCHVSWVNSTISTNFV